MSIKYVAYDKHGWVVCRINWWANILKLLKCDKDNSKIRLIFFLDSKATTVFVYFFQNMSITLQNCQYAVREQCRKAESWKFKKTFLPLHTELLSVESCDICVIEIPHSCVQITHWTHARCSVSSRNCWQRTTKSLAHFLPHQPELQSFLYLC